MHVATRLFNNFINCSIIKPHLVLQHLFWRHGLISSLFCLIIHKVLFQQNSQIKFEARSFLCFDVLIVFKCIQNDWVFEHSGFGRCWSFVSSCGWLSRLAGLSCLLCLFWEQLVLQWNAWALGSSRLRWDGLWCLAVQRRLRIWMVQGFWRLDIQVELDTCRKFDEATRLWRWAQGISPALISQPYKETTCQLDSIWIDRWPALESLIALLDVRQVKRIFWYILGLQICSRILSIRRIQAPWVCIQFVNHSYILGCFNFWQSKLEVGFLYHSLYWIDRVVIFWFIPELQHVEPFFNFIAHLVIFMFWLCLRLPRPWRYYPPERLVIIL